MVLLRKLLFPFAVLYGAITLLRNRLFDAGILKSYSFDLPVIAVGNLSVGGTGKSPQIEYLIGLLSKEYRIATLSRGYKRQSEGFILADARSDAKTLGDEPFQFYTKFPNILVAVDANRKNGIEQLLAQPEKPEVILLDDAFQHRKVKAGFYILLTAYGDLYCDDFMLPTGNLREGRNGAARANVVVVTKCPKDLPLGEQNAIREKLKLKAGQELYFTFINYDDTVYSADSQLRTGEVRTINKVLLAGIAKPQPFFDHLSQEGDVVLEFPDHHDFSEAEISGILAKAGDRIIITTEKDYMRLKGRIPAEKLFWLPIRTQFLSNGGAFDQSILDFVRRN